MELWSAKFNADASQSIRSVENDQRFSDFTVENGVLKFTWKSPQSGSSCKVSIFASDDYPQNSLITLLWEPTDKETSCHYHAPITNLLEILGTEVQTMEEQVKNNNKVLPVTGASTKNGILKAASSPNVSDSVKDDNDSSELSGSDWSDFSVEDMSEDLSYNDCDSLMETETIGNGRHMAPVHLLLAKDIKRLQAIYSESSLSYRFLNSIREVDLDLFIPLKFPNLTHQIAKAWRVNLEEPLVIRINLSSDHYLDMTDPPKIEVFQKSASGESCGIAHQMKNILQLFLREKCKKLRNSDLQAAAVRSQSEPMDFSSATKWTTNQETQETTCKSPAASDLQLVSDEALACLLDMGFEERSACHALTLAHNNLEDAVVLLTDHSLMNAEENADSQKAFAEAKTISTNSSSSHMVQSKSGSKAGLPRSLRNRWPGSKKTDPTVQSIRTSHTEPNLGCTSTCKADGVVVSRTSTNAKEMPGLEDGFLVMLYRYAQQRLSSLNEYCIVCDEPHIFQNGAMLKPAVCSRALCVFAFQTLGLMADAACDIATGAEVVDLLIALTKAACRSARRTIIFEPFPDLVDPNNSKNFVFSAERKDFYRLEQVLNRVPDMNTLSTMVTIRDMKTQLGQIDVLLFPLLTWIISSNRSHIVKLAADRLLSFMVTPHQFLLLSSPPAKEAAFQDAKRRYGSTFAFHGSNIENWHSIIRQGLVVASDTPRQVNGAAYGKGIYLSPESHLSFRYSSMGYSIHKLKETQKPKMETPNRFLATEKLSCISLCEVITSPKLRKILDIWVCPNCDHVCTRFLFVYENGEVGENVDMTLGSNKKAVEKVLSLVSHVI